MQHGPISEGRPQPLGATIYQNGMNFALFSEHAKKVTLCFLDVHTKEILEEIPFDFETNRTGFIWHLFIENLPLPLLYAYRVDGSHKSPFFYHAVTLLSDPYAKVLDVSQEWGKREFHHPLGLLNEELTFDWEGDSFPRISSKDLIIYEMHVRSFTKDESSKVAHPGTFLGIIEKIPYLLDLGINAVELMPIQEFNECSYTRHNPTTKEHLFNYWGYSSINFFSPMNRYAVGKEHGSAILEFKTLVRALHKNGIEVILDVVFNHTGEKKHMGDAYSFIGIDRPVYYMLTPEGKDQNFTGCGNTVNVNHPVTRQFIRECLHYWVLEMHVDGFRFDLASVMNRDMAGNLLDSSPLIEELSLDPILADTKLIAEPWDAAGAYQVGGFYHQRKRWSEWNGKYRDSVRSFIKGDYHSKKEFANRLCGSQDLFPGRDATASLNFITCHDGFTLKDLVSYNEKHNLANGENNQDGNSNNISWNCGVEGETDDPKIHQMRERQMKNFIVALMISRGIPMLLMGDEYGHSRQGNNNTWCQDNKLNYFLWNEPTSFYRFVKKMIQFRINDPLLHKENFYQDQEIFWHGIKPDDASWDKEKAIIVFSLLNVRNEKHLYVAFNATSEVITFNLPELTEGKKWCRMVDTFLETPNDFNEDDVCLTGYEYTIHEYSSIIMKVK